MKIYKSIFYKTTATLLILLQACSPSKKRPNPKSIQEPVQGILEITVNENTHQRKIVAEGNVLKTDAALVVPNEPLPINITFAIEVKNKNLGEPAQNARLKVGKVAKDVPVQFSKKDVQPNGFKGVFTIAEPFKDETLTAGQKVDIELTFTNGKLATQVRTAPIPVTVDSVEVPVNSAVKIQLTSGTQATMVRRFEVKNASNTDLRINPNHFIKAVFYRSFGGYKSYQYDGCNGGHKYVRHRSIISERMVLVDTFYTTDLLEELDKTLDNPAFEVVIPAGEKKPLLLFVLLPPLYTLDNLSQCWSGTEHVVKACDWVCDLRMPITNECVRSHLQPRAPEAVPVTRNIDGHGLIVSDLWNQSQLEYADIPTNYSQLKTSAPAVTQQITVNGAVEFESPVDAMFPDCKL